MKHIALIALIGLSGCTYRTMDACEDATGTVCHMTIFGDYVRGPGIPIDSPAGQAILSGVLAGGGLYQPVQIQPYVLPMPQVPQRQGFTCTGVGSSTISCY
jgi:hypothetical protein